MPAPAAVRARQRVVIDAPPSREACRAVAAPWLQSVMRRCRRASRYPKHVSFCRAVCRAVCRHICFMAHQRVPCRHNLDSQIAMWHVPRRHRRRTTCCWPWLRGTTLRAASAPLTACCAAGAQPALARRNPRPVARSRKSAWGAAARAAWRETAPCAALATAAAGRLRPRPVSTWPSPLARPTPAPSARLLLQTAVCHSGLAVWRSVTQSGLARQRQLPGRRSAGETGLGRWCAGAAMRTGARPRRTAGSSRCARAGGTRARWRQGLVGSFAGEATATGSCGPRPKS